MVACCVPRSPSTELFEVLGKHTGQALERTEREFERDRWFSADEAKRCGLIDHLIESSGDLRIVAAQPNGCRLARQMWLRMRTQP